MDGNTSRGHIGQLKRGSTGQIIDSASENNKAMDDNLLNKRRIQMSTLM